MDREDQGQGSTRARGQDVRWSAMDNCMETVEVVSRIRDS